MSNEQEIIKELLEIKQLLNQLIDKPKVTKQRTAPFNKSKNMNDEQRKQVMEYIQNEDNKNEITKLPKHKQISYVRRELKEKYNINLSIYMTDKLINKIMP